MHRPRGGDAPNARTMLGFPHGPMLRSAVDPIGRLLPIWTALMSGSETSRVYSISWAWLAQTVGAVL